MKSATLFVFIGQLVLAMATVDPTRYSVLSVLYTAIPSAVRSALAAKATTLTFDDAHALEWYTPLPADVKSLLPVLYPTSLANSASPSATTTVCKTETLTSTLTVTVTAHSSSPAVPPVGTSTPPANSSPAPSHPVPSVPASSVVPINPTSVPAVPPFSSHSTVNSGSSTVWLTVPSAPYPTGNSTASATSTAPHSSGTGATPSTSTPLTAPTSGAGKTAINGLVMGLVVVGGAFLSF